MSNILQLWILPINNETKLVSDYEKHLSKKLSPKRSQEFIYSRGCIREVLSEHLGIKPLNLPLDAPPGRPPKLKNGLGNITFSHCRDALFIGWSNVKVGVDIERKDRNLNSSSLIKRFYCEEEKRELEDLDKTFQREKTLKYWILKEAAIKWQEGSIAKDLSNWLIKEKQNEIYHKRFDILLKTEFKSHNIWLLGLAHKSNNLEIRPLIKFI